MNRRGFLGVLSGLMASTVLDPERLLWVPDTKKIFIPASIVRPASQIIGMAVSSIKKGNYGFIQVWGPSQSLQNLIDTESLRIVRLVGLGRTAIAIEGKGLQRINDGLYRYCRFDKDTTLGEVVTAQDVEIS